MSPPTHLAVNTLLGISLYKTGFVETLNLLGVFIIAGWLIDIDHIIYTCIKHKTLSPKKIFQIEKRAGENMQVRFYVFHSLEFNFTLLVAGIFYPILHLFFLSNIIHISLDVIAHYRYHKNFRFIKEWSPLFHLRKIL